MQAEKNHPQFAEHVRLLDESNVWDAAHSWGWAKSMLVGNGSDGRGGKAGNGAKPGPKLKDKLNMDEFVAVVQEIDNHLRALPATAQVNCPRVLSPTRVQTVDAQARLLEFVVL